MEVNMMNKQLEGELKDAWRQRERMDRLDRRDKQQATFWARWMILESIGEAASTGSDRVDERARGLVEDIVLESMRLGEDLKAVRLRRAEAKYLEYWKILAKELDKLELERRDDTRGTKHQSEEDDNLESKRIKLDIEIDEICKDFNKLETDYNTKGLLVQRAVPQLESAGLGTSEENTATDFNSTLARPNNKNDKLDVVPERDTLTSTEKGVDDTIIIVMEVESLATEKEAFVKGTTRGLAEERSPVKDIVKSYEAMNIGNTTGKEGRQASARKWVRTKSGLYGWRKVKAAKPFKKPGDDSILLGQAESVQCQKKLTKSENFDTHRFVYRRS